MVSNSNVSWFTCSWYLLILALICLAFWKRAGNWSCYNYIWRHFLNVCHTFDISRWSIEHNRRKVGNARSRINNSTFYNKASMTSSIAGKIPIFGFVEGCWHLKEGRETPFTSIQVIAEANVLFYCIRQERDRLLIRKCWSGGRMIFLISVLSLESWSIGRWARGLKRVK